MTGFPYILKQIYMLKQISLIIKNPKPQQNGGRRRPALGAPQVDSLLRKRYLDHVLGGLV
jgi:hypothetical protein